MQGDQIVIGRMYGLAELGVYAAVFGLLSAPTLIIAKVSISLLLPVYSAKRNDRDAFEKFHKLSSQTLGLLAIALTGGFIALGVTAVTLIYGRDYTPDLWLIAALATMQGIRTLRIVPTIASIAHGDTANAMFANIFRVAFLPVAIYLASEGTPVAAIAACGAAGEVAAFLFTMFRLARRDQLRPSTDISVFAVTLIAVVMVLAVASTTAPIASDVLTATGSLIALVCVIVGALACWHVLRREIGNTIASILTRRTDRAPSQSPEVPA